jgi:opacity protein-like surface antigen
MAGGAALELESVVNAGAFGSANTAWTHGAWTAGGGVVFTLTDSLSARGGYLYLDTGNVDTADIAGPISVSGRVQENRVQENMVRLALNYRLPVAW